MKVAVLGVGLIGGSIGLAARRRAAAHVCGWDPDPHALARALQLGALDEAAPDLPAAVAQADLVFLAVPVGSLVERVGEVLRHAPTGALVTDVGSTKGALMRAITDPRFIGGHPLTGSEVSGVEHARDDLFAGATWYLTTTAAGAALPTGLHERLQRLIVSFGAEPVPIDADTHDRLMAVVSHLPHVLANLLVAQLTHAREQELPSTPSRTPGIGPSFRDATRVAGSNSAIWTDIYMSNRYALIAAVDELAQRLARVRADLQAGDERALRDWNEHARAERETLLGPAS